MHRTLAAALSYPDERVAAERSWIADGAPAELAAWTRRWAEADAQALRREYVESFDFSSRCALDLTYHRFGDQRERGRALLDLKRLYRAAGFELEPAVLPDFLPVVLELAAEAPELGAEVLDEYAAEVETIRRGLHAAGSRWAEPLDVLCATLAGHADLVAPGGSPE